MAAWTWRTWPDVLIDFGREAYVAWRLSLGEVLQRDVATVSGPFSPYWNALAFRVLGVGLDTLFLSNALWLVALLALLHRLLRRAADRLAAGLGCALVLLLFAFAQYVGIGNYNYLAPYSHELTHGLTLGLGALAALDRFGRGGGAGFAALGGTALGCALLTKPEIGLATGLAVAAWWALRPTAPGREGRRGLAALAAGTALPPLLSGLALSLALPPLEAARATAGGWVPLFEHSLAGLPFYRTMLGSDDPGGNLLRMGAVAGGLGLAGAGALAAGRLAGSRRGLPVALFLGVAAAGVLGFARIPWMDLARPLPLVMTGAAVWILALHRRGTPPDLAPRRALQLALTVHAGALLFKIALHARIEQYGFALAMPAAVLASVAAVSWLPDAARRRGLAGGALRAAALGALLAFVVAGLRLQAPFVAYKTEPVAEAPDRFYAHPGIAKPIRRAHRWLAEELPEAGRAVVLPEGVMLDYLARRRLPGRHFSYLPFDLHVHGEEAMRAALEAAPPDAVVLVHLDTTEHGARFLGRDYGAGLLAWIRARYAPALRIGEPPLTPGTRFGITIWVPRPG